MSHRFAVARGTSSNYDFAVGSGSCKSSLGVSAEVACIGVALMLLLCAVRAPQKNWLLDYYPNPSLDGPVGTRAWIRSASFRVPDDVLLSRIPDRPDFSLRLRSCLPISEPTELVVRLSANEHARIYVDGGLMMDSGQPTDDPQATDDSESRKDPNEAGAGLPTRHLQLRPGNHLIAVEYSNKAGSGALRLEMSQKGVSQERLLSWLRRPSLDGECGSL